MRPSGGWWVQSRCVMVGPMLVWCHFTLLEVSGQMEKLPNGQSLPHWKGFILFFLRGSNQHALKRDNGKMKKLKKIIFQENSFLSFRKPAPVTIPEKVGCHTIRVHFGKFGQLLWSRQLTWGSLQAQRRTRRFQDLWILIRAEVSFVCESSISNAWGDSCPIKSCLLHRQRAHPEPCGWGKENCWGSKGSFVGHWKPDFPPVGFAR